jgi:hypothetical protein
MVNSEWGIGNGLYRQREATNEKQETRNSKQTLNGIL